MRIISVTAKIASAAIAKPLPRCLALIAQISPPKDSAKETTPEAPYAIIPTIIKARTPIFSARAISTAKNANIAAVIKVKTKPITERTLSLAGLTQWTSRHL